MKNLLKLVTLFSVGGFVYCLIELLFRSYTHWTMFVVGGLCFVFVGAINEIYTYNMSLVGQMLISAIFITAVELITGLILNVCLGLGIWNYNHMPYNLFGQICLLYFCVWFLLSLVGILLDDWLRYWLFDERKPHYKVL